MPTKFRSSNWRTAATGWLTQYVRNCVEAFASAGYEAHASTFSRRMGLLQSCLHHKKTVHFMFGTTVVSFAFSIWNRYLELWSLTKQKCSVSFSSISLFPKAMYGFSFVYCQFYHQSFPFQCWCMKNDNIPNTATVGNYYEMMLATHAISHINLFSFNSWEENIWNQWATKPQFSFEKGNREWFILKPYAPKEEDLN